ncbi:hypothetical protein ACV566_12865 [Staphylococcus aureus]
MGWLICSYWYFISQAGPGGAIIAHLVIGVMLYFLMSSIGELATFYPVSGSFSLIQDRLYRLISRLYHGWLYWALWSLVTSVDVIVASNVLYFWGRYLNFSPSRLLGN